MRALVLRPQPGADATAARIRAWGGKATVAPLFQIRPAEWDVPDSAAHDALVLTSANAVRHAGVGLARLKSLPVFAVGESTAQAARAAGLYVRAVGTNNAEALFASIAAAGVMRPLRLVGADHGAVTRSTLIVTTRIVYRADAATELPPNAIEALAAGAVALLHSPRAAALFGSMIGTSPQRAGIRIAAISAATANAAGEGWQAVAIAAVPTDDALLAAAARLCETGAGPEKHAGA